jgi:hypothetical protein
MTEIERALPSERYRLFTSVLNKEGLSLYAKMGYLVYKEEEVGPKLRFAHLEKFTKS